MGSSNSASTKAKLKYPRSKEALLTSLRAAGDRVETVETSDNRDYENCIDPYRLFNREYSDLRDCQYMTYPHGAQTA